MQVRSVKKDSSATDRRERRQWGRYPVAGFKVDVLKLKHWRLAATPHHVHKNTALPPLSSPLPLSYPWFGKKLRGPGAPGTSRRVGGTVNDTNETR